jgi:hypothetical protein
MGAQIVCPNCKKVFSDNPVIEDASKGEGSAQQFITCDCGERITYWQITAQIREQNSISRRFKKWIQSLSRSSS